MLARVCHGNLWVKRLVACVNGHCNSKPLCVIQKKSKFVSYCFCYIILSYFILFGDMDLFLINKYTVYKRDVCIYEKVLKKSPKVQSPNLRRVI